MKKTAVIAILALVCSLVSCKKDRTCTCTYSKPWASSSEVQVTTYDNITEKSARANCTSGTSFEPSDPSKVEVRNCTLN